MRWQIGRRSENVEDRRGVGVPRIAGMGVGGIVLALIAWYFGGDPSMLMNSLQGTRTVTVGEGVDDESKDFVRSVLGTTEDVWRAQFQKMGRTYTDPKLVLFTDAVESACGLAEAAVGPFYCPADDQVYLDVSFFRDLKQRFSAPGDFAEAYVIAHEVGHHVQDLLGISDQVAERRSGLSEEEYNQLSVRLELQADFFAGLWAHYAQEQLDMVEPGDIEEALNAASAIGDDRLQMQSRGYVTPDSFTHGTSQQRVRWFKRGFETGDFSQGDTFKARDL